MSQTRYGEAQKEAQRDKERHRETQWENTSVTSWGMHIERQSYAKRKTPIDRHSETKRNTRRESRRKSRKETQRLEQKYKMRVRKTLSQRLRECESARVRECKSARVRECESGWERVRPWPIEKRFRFSFYFFSRDSSPVWRRGSKGPWRTLELGVIAALFHRSTPPLLLLWGCTSATTTSSSSSSPRLDPTKYLESTLFPLLISFSVLCQEVSHCPQQHTSDIKNYFDIVQRYQESV